MLCPDWLARVAPVFICKTHSCLAPVQCASRAGPCAVRRSCAALSRSCAKLSRVPLQSRRSGGLILASWLHKRTRNDTAPVSIRATDLVQPLHIWPACPNPQPAGSSHPRATRASRHSAACRLWLRELSIYAYVSRRDRALRQQPRSRDAPSQAERYVARPAT
jgi:hypothetical protein